MQMSYQEMIGLGPCCVCGQPLPDGPVPLFYLVAVRRMGIDAHAMRRHFGVAMALNGSMELADALGPREPVARLIDGPLSGVVHEHCAGAVRHVLQCVRES